MELKRGDIFAVIPSIPIETYPEGGAVGGLMFIPLITDWCCPTDLCRVPGLTSVQNNLNNCNRASFVKWPKLHLVQKAVSRLVQEAGIV